MLFGVSCTALEKQPWTNSALWVKEPPPDFKAKILKLRSIASLCDPAKLSTLKKGNRAANQRFRKLMFWIADYTSFLSPEDTIGTMYEVFITKPYANEDHVFAPKTEILNLLANWRLGELYGLHTKENLELLRHGKAPIITKGKYKGEKAHVDHILPVSKYPELENSMANLRWLPESLNRKKSDEITNVAKRRARDLMKEAGWKFKGY